MLRDKTGRCERCAFSTPVNEEKIFCSFARCPYENHPDPFGEKRAAEKYKAEMALKAEEEKKKEQEEKPKKSRARKPKENEEG